MRSKTFCLITLIMISLLMLSGCGKKEPEDTPTPTADVFLPTRSVATVPVPTQASTCTNYMSFLDDVTYGDGTVVEPGQKFLKEWEVINYSTCNWDEKYHLFFISGDQMGAPDYLEVPHIPIGSRGKISVELTAPDKPGEYRSEWKLFGADNRFFGESLIAEITVREPVQSYY